MPKKERRVSIVMVVRNKLEFTKQCLDALFVNTKGFELIVVDDGSSDATPKYLREQARKHKNIQLIRNAQPQGPEYSIYLGSQKSRFETLCLLHNDVIPLSGWLEQMKSAMDKQTGAVGALLLQTDETIQHAGIEFDADFLPYYRFYGKSLPTVVREKIKEVPAVSTACLLTTRKVMDSVIGLTADFFIDLLRDADLCLKMREQGYKIRWQPQAVLYHFEMEKQGELAQNYSGSPSSNIELFRQKWARKAFLLK